MYHMNTPILDALTRLMEGRHTNFHVPGHKNRNALIEWSKYIPYIDTTEIEGMDNLLDPRGIIKESQDLAARVYGSKATYYSVNGSTGSNYIAMAAITKPGDKVLVQRDSHKSIYNGLVLNRLEPIYIYPNYSEEHHLLTGLDPELIEKSIQDNPDVKAVIITNPNYYGVCSNLEEIVKVVHKYEKVLMVDEAHGSHLVFSDKLPLSAIEAGADIVIHSTHKTLASLTQTSMIHICSDRVDLNRLRECFNLFTTTSPSYIFLLSNELAAAYMDGEGRERLDRSVDKVEELVRRLKDIDRVLVLSKEDDSTIYDKDITKILFRLEGMTGSHLNRLLMEEYDIILEMADYYYCLALTSLMNQDRDFDRLVLALEDLAKRTPYQEINQVSLNILKPLIRMNITESFYADKEIINLKDSIGRVAATSVMAYPPGVPLLVPGEEISQELYEHIGFIRENGLEIVGLMGYNKDQIVVIK